jgi:hypothetical protein
MREERDQDERGGGGREDEAIFHAQTDASPVAQVTEKVSAAG